MADRRSKRVTPSLRERLGIVAPTRGILPGGELDRWMIARILGSLFVLGSLLLLTTLLLPDAPGRRTSELAIIAGASCVCALILIASYDRIPLTVLTFVPFAGTVLVGFVIYYSDPSHVTAYAMYFAWVLVAASLFLDARLILMHGVLAVAVYAGALGAAGHIEAGFTLGIVMLTGSVFATTLAMGSIGHHVRIVMAQLHSAAQTDSLTGLLNRRAFDDAFGRELARAQRAGDPLGVVILDLDGFKRFNDNRGHQEGDLALQRLGLVLADKTRAGDVMARIGGEEFALLVPNSDTPGVLVLAERLRRGVEVEFGGDGNLTASCGVASYPANGETSAALVTAADRALYKAKRQGRNRVVAAPEGAPDLRVVGANS